MGEEASVGIGRETKYIHDSTFKFTLRTHSIGHYIHPIPRRTLFPEVPGAR